MSEDIQDDKSTVEESVDESTQVDEGAEAPAVDYKAELEKLRSERDKYKTEAEVKGRDLRELRKDRRSKREETPELSEESSAPEIDAAIRKGLDAIERRRIQDEIDTQLEEIAKDPDERALVKEVYENGIQASGFTRKAIKDDLMRAILLANRSRFEADIEKKVRKSVAEKEAIEKSNITTKGTVSEETASDEKISRADKAFMRGFKTQNNL